MKGWSNELGGQEIQTEVTMRYHLLKLVKILKSDNTHCWWGCGEKDSYAWLVGMCSLTGFEHFTLETSVLDTNPFLDTWFVNIVFHSVTWLSIPSTASFAEQKCLILLKFNTKYFISWNMLLMYLKTHYQTQDHLDFLLCFLLEAL